MQQRSRAVSPFVSGSAPAFPGEPAPEPVRSPPRASSSVPRSSLRVRDTTQGISGGVSRRPHSRDLRKYGPAAVLGHRPPNTPPQLSLFQTRHRSAFPPLPPTSASPPTSPATTPTPSTSHRPLL